MARRKTSSRNKKKKHIAIVIAAVVAVVALLFEYSPTTGQPPSIRASAENIRGKIASVAEARQIEPRLSIQGKQQETPFKTRIDGLEHATLPKKTRSEIVKHLGYVVSHNSKWKLPNWVGYELTAMEVRGKIPRNDDFQPDPDVKGHKAQLADYKGSGYDRGHMAPAADMKWSKKAMRESFYLSNICPQDPSLNRGDWNDLEEKVRQWALRDSAIVVVCGPILSKRPATIGHGKVAVPKAFFKVVLSPYSETPSAIGFVMPNTKGNNPLRTYAMTVDEVEKITSIDFFAALPDSIEDVVEAECNLSYWGL